MIKKALFAWLPLFLLGQGFFWFHEGFYLAHQGVFLSKDYRGLLFADLIYARFPAYAGLQVIAYHLGLILWLPVFCHLFSLPAPPLRRKDYAGNVIETHEWRTVLERYRRFRAKKRWDIHLQHRNQVFAGFDLVTGKPVFLEDETLFSGLLIVGKQGSGKTESYVKALCKQLALDPADRTAFVFFTKKDEDTRDFGAYLTGLGKRTLPWSMCNILDLALDRTGGLEPGHLQSLLQGACGAAGLGSARDPFWLNSAVRRIVAHVFALSAKGEYVSWGKAYQAFKDQAEGQEKPSEMELGLLETLAAAFGPMLDPTSRLSLLHAPHTDGGLHVGPLWAAPRTTLHEFTREGMVEHHTGDQAHFFPGGVFEVPAKCRLPIDWEILLQPCSVLLPPFGSGKGERFALNLAKQTLLSWMAEDIASPRSRLLHRKPADRFRLVLAQDEGHNFLALSGEGMTDTQANQELRQAGLVNLIASQSLTALAKGSERENKAFFSVQGAMLFLGVNGPERSKVLDIVGKVQVKKLETTLADSKGSAGPQRQRSDTVSQRVTETQQPFIDVERYGQLPPGVAILITQGQPHRLIYCPLHDRLDFRYPQPAKKGGFHGHR